MNIQTFGALWAAQTTVREAGFDRLWKGMNTIQLQHDAALVNKPLRAGPDLLAEAARNLRNSPRLGRGDELAALRLATARKKAIVRGPTPVKPNAAATPASAAASTGMGAGGYSGNNASKVGQASNQGYSTASTPAPNPNPAPAPTLPAPPQPSRV